MKKMVFLEDMVYFFEKMREFYVYSFEEKEIIIKSFNI